VAAPAGLVAATFAYAFIFVTVEIGAFAAVISLRAPGADGGTLGDYAGLGRTAPWRSGALAFAVIGLAGLPPALAGLFAKVFVVRALVDARAWAVVAAVALAAIVGLAVYLRAVLPLYRDGAADGWILTRVSPAIAVVLTVATMLAVAAGFAPQLILDLTTF
jgi:NADH-quinone oxidoreductase subunit N